MSGKILAADDAEDYNEEGKRRKKGDDDVMELLDEKFKCSFCMQLPERPVTVRSDSRPYFIFNWPHLATA